MSRSVTMPISLSSSTTGIERMSRRRKSPITFCSESLGPTAVGSTVMQSRTRSFDAISCPLSGSHGNPISLVQPLLLPLGGRPHPFGIDRLYRLFSELRIRFRKSGVIAFHVHLEDFDL